MKKLLIILVVYFIANNANAQTTPADSTLKKSPLETLSNSQYDALLTGKDISGMGVVAELNHYPDPEKVIKLKKELDLSPIQTNKISAISKEIHRKKLEMGLTIIKNETVIDSLFHHNIVDNGALIFYANRYGIYQGELRNAILQACLATRLLLTHQQIIKFYALQKAN